MNDDRPSGTDPLSEGGETGSLNFEMFKQLVSEQKIRFEQRRLLDELSTEMEEMQRCLDKYLAIHNLP